MQVPAVDSENLVETAKQLVVSGKGIYATDASESTMDKRLSGVGIQPTPEIRRKFREVMLTTPGLGEFISGVILNDEIIKQKTESGISFSELVRQSNMLCGIKVDKKTHDMANFPGEKMVEGLDGLRERFVEYKNMGVKFSKWRTVINLGEGIPTLVCIESNSHATARYASLSQEAGLVPIVEPEVLMDGNHDMERDGKITSLAINSLFYHLREQKVNLSGLILKINMVLPGKENPDKPDAEHVADVTLEVLKRSVPEDVTGVVFLSGGQSAKDATARLNEIVKLNGTPWKLSFSFERALEGPAMETWEGKAENVDKAQKAILHRAKLNSLAVKGEYQEQMEDANGKI